MACPKCGGTLEPGRVTGAFFHFTTGDLDEWLEARSDRTAPAYAYPIPPGAARPQPPARPFDLAYAGHKVTARAGRCTECGWIEVDRESIEIEPPKPRGPHVPWYRRLFGRG